MKRYLSLTLFVVSSVCTSSLFVGIPAFAAIQCYPQKGAEGGMGSQNTIVIPPFRAHETTRYDVIVSNIGRMPVNVKLRLFNHNGNYHLPGNLSFAHNFSAENNPVEQLDGSGGAWLKSLETGFVRITDTDHSGHFTGFLTWQANKCLTEPTLSVTLQNSVWGGSYYDGGFITVNGGNPF